MTSPTVRVYKIAWNGNDGEVWYTDAGGAVDYLRTLLGRFGFHVGTPVATPDRDGFLQALPVVKPGGSLTELRDICRQDPGIVMGLRDRSGLGREKMSA
jgi:hypothetical protein